jgi:hypothetical protein
MPLRNELNPPGQVREHVDLKQLEIAVERDYRKVKKWASRHMRSGQKHLNHMIRLGKGLLKAKKQV